MDEGMISARWPIVSAPAEDPRSLRRREDIRFLTGKGQYVDDAPVEGELFGYVLRSPHSHAEILGIDAEAALALAGVHAVFTASDLAEAGLQPLPCYITVQTVAPLIIPPRFPLAQGRVRHVGDPVAFIVAESREAARDAAELVQVDYDILPSVTETQAAPMAGAPQIWEQAPENIAFRFKRGDTEKAADAFSSAAHVVECQLVNNRIVAAALETRIAVGHWKPETERYHLHLSGASVHAIQRELAQGVFGLPLEQIEVSCPDVGGGFGMKNVLYPEYALVLFAAKKLGAPVRWMAERIDEFTSGVHGRDNVTTARLALDADHRFLALAVETTANLGAYLSSLGPGSSTNAPSTAMGGLYNIPAIMMDVRGVFTNTVPIDAYRGAGKPEANYIIERLIDIAAHELKLDPVELRRRNLIRHFPHRSALGITLDCGDFTGNLERVLLAADHAGFVGRKKAAEKHGKLRGIGMGCFLETSRGQPNEEAWLTVKPEGTIEIAIGTQSNGQGHETSFPQVVAARLGMPLEVFRLVQGDTREVPRGGGHGGARSLHMGGAAMVLAVDDLLAKATPLAAQLLQSTPERLAYSNGAFHALDNEGEVSLQAIAQTLVENDGKLQGHGNNICDVFTFPNGCQIAEVEIDPETGHVKLERYVAVDDYGTLVNPLLTESQVQGGLAQGIGQALMEEALYDPESGQIISATFMDYAMPRAIDLPMLELKLVEVPTKANPLGAKGSGQAGCIGAPQTIMNAVLNALRPVGVTALDMPVTPNRVWQAIETARTGQHLR